MMGVRWYISRSDEEALLSMRILIIGGGGREHALGYVLAKDPARPELFFAPGNAGTASLGTNVDLVDGDDINLLAFVRKETIDLVIVGPEAPLVRGIANTLEKEGVRVIGPTAAAARLEGSKSFSKDFMIRHGIPTAKHRTFHRSQYDEARAYIESEGAPIVLKASGLAGGKGAVVCRTLSEAIATLDAIFRTDVFGSAGDELVVEEFMIGEEASIFALCDGNTYSLLLPAQDHKAIGENDTGPNTGGMGAYTPAPIIDDGILAEVERLVIEPTLRGMEEEGCPYKGVLFVGLMITDEGPRVIEYNCRLGDPEAQVVLPMLETSAVEMITAIANGELSRITLRNRPGAAATVVLSSGGYPGSYQTGYEITGLDRAGEVDGVTVFHSGTRIDERGRILTAGGRVLSVTAIGETLDQALLRAYSAADLISFEGKYARRDIGRKGLARMA